MHQNKKPVYLNTAACGLIPDSVLQSGVELYKGFEQCGSAASERWRDFDKALIRKRIADFAHAPEKNIALVPNFSTAMNMVVHSLKGDEKVLLYRKDYPSLYLPFVLNKFDITWIEDEGRFFLDMDQMASVIKENKIDIVAISHIQYQSGFKINLRALGEICRQHNALLITDGTQSLGGMNIDLSELQPDVFIASSYKWMNGGFGTGIMYMNDLFLEKYPPKVSGAASDTFTIRDNEYEHQPRITDYEPGNINQFGFTILHKSIEEKNIAGMDKIEKHNLQLTQQLLDGLAVLPVQVIGDHTTTHRNSIVSIYEAEGLHAWLQEQNIITTLRNGLIRISIHYHNSQEDVTAILEAIRSKA